MPERDPYRILGVPSDASPEEITAAYIDHLSSTTDLEKLDAIEKAYEALASGAKDLPPSGGPANAADSRSSMSPRPVGRSTPLGKGEDRATRRPTASEEAAAPRDAAESRAEEPEPAPSDGTFDPYRALNLTPKATPQQIEAAYERLMEMTRRKARRAEIELAYQMLISAHPAGPAETAARSVNWGVRPRPAVGADGKRPERARAEAGGVRSTRAQARRDRKTLTEETRGRRPARRREESSRSILYVGFGVLAVIIVAVLVFANVSGLTEPKDFGSLVDRGNAAYDRQDWAGAEKWYTKALAVNGTDSNVRTDLGVALFYQGKVDAAIREYQVVLSSEPTKYQTLLNLGIALANKNPADVDGAAAAWQKVIDTNTDPSVIQQAKDLIAKYKK